MNIKVAIAEDNSFLLDAVKEKISFFDDLFFKYAGVNENEIIELIKQDHNIDVVLPHPGGPINVK